MTAARNASAAWFASLGERFELDTRGEASRLFGQIWCGGRDGDTDAALDALCARILAQPETLFGAADAMMLLLAGAGCASEAFHQYRAAVVRSIEAGSSESQAHPKSVALLIAAGAVDAEDGAARVAAAVHTAPSLDALLDRSAGAAAWVCAAVEVLTRGGARPTAAAAVGEARLEVLAALMLADCRRYDLVSAASILRALGQADAAADAVADVRAFLTLQSRDAGGYGHINPFADAAPRGERWEDVAFRLPISAACVRALHAREVTVS